MNWRENPRQRTDRLPLAYRLRDDLLELLADEQYGANAQLPSEKELSSQFSVSRSTVREALKLLEEERLVYCIHGVGRFMAPEPISMLKGDIVRLESVSEMAARLGIPIETRVLSLAEVPATESVATNLGINSGDPVIRLERVRSTGGQPVIYSIDRFAKSLVTVELDEDKSTGSLFRIMEEEWNLDISYCRSTIRAVTLDRGTSSKIGVPPGTPWVLFEQVNYDRRHRPVLDSEDYHRGDQFQFSLLRRRK